MMFFNISKALALLILLTITSINRSWADSTPSTLDLSQVKNYAQENMSPMLKTCLQVGNTLYTEGKWQDSIQRIETCSRNSITSFDDVLQVIHYRLELSENMLYSLNWVDHQKFPEETGIVQIFKTKLAEYIALHPHDSESSFLEEWGAPILLAGLGVTVGMSVAIDTEDTPVMPYPVLNKKFTSKQLKKMRVIKQLLKQNTLLIKSWYQQANQQQISALMANENMSNLRVTRLKKEYAVFLNDYVMLPILNRTNQLLSIADDKGWIGSDDETMVKAAKVLARLDKNMILSANNQSQMRFFQVFKKFKKQAGTAQMEMLKAIQDLSYSEQEASGADKWFQE